MSHPCPPRHDASVRSVAFKDASLSAADKAPHLPAVPLGPIRSGVGPRADDDVGSAAASSPENADGGGGRGLEGGSDDIAETDASRQRALDATLGLDADDDEALGLLLRADAVWASPLTRALQTALVALHGHPALDRGVALHASAREIKGVAGLDCVGLEVGADAIKDRARRKLAQSLVAGADDDAGVTSPVAKEASVLSAAGHAAALVTAPQLLPRDCATEWWTKTDSYEHKDAVALRYGEFLREVQYASLEGDARAPLVVGHSLFIRGLFERFLSEDLTTKHPDLAHALKTRKLANCGLVYAEFVFDDARDAPPVVADARLLFRSRLEPPKKQANNAPDDPEQPGPKRPDADGKLKAKAAAIAEKTAAKTKLFANKAKEQALKLRGTFKKPRSPPPPTATATAVADAAPPPVVQPPPPPPPPAFQTPVRAPAAIAAAADDDDDDDELAYRGPLPDDAVSGTNPLARGSPEGKDPPDLLY